MHSAEILAQFPNGGAITVPFEVKRGSSDFLDLVKICQHFAKEGYKTIILPKVHYKDPLYKKYFSELNETKYAGKCPDLKIGDYFYEYESFVFPFNNRKINNMLNRGIIQSNRLILNNNCGATDNYIKRIARHKMYSGGQIDELWIIKDSVLERLI